MKLKSAVIGFAYLAGLICAFLLGLSPSLCLIILPVGVLAGFIFIKFKAFDIGLFLVVFAVAFGVYALLRTSTMDKIHALDGETREITGIVREKTAPAHDMAGYTIEAVIDGTRTRFSMFTLDTGAEVGDTVTFEARFALMRDNTAFSEASYYMSRGIFLRAAAVTAPVVTRSENFSITGAIRGFNDELKHRIMIAFPNDTGALICAVFLGDRSMISDSLSRNISRAGIAHYTAVSGLHLTLMAHMFMTVFNLTRLRVMRRFKFVLLASMTLVFMVFFNFTPSVTRAGLMLIIFYGGELFMRRGNTLNSIGFAALIILLFSPFSAIDAGLLLSIAGTIGIGVIAPAVNNHFTSPRFKRLREAFFANLCANYSTLPFVAVFFGGASLVSLFTSIILLPLFTILLTAMVVFALSAPIPFLGGFLLLVAGIMSRIMQAVIMLFGNLKFAYAPLNYSFVLPWAISSAIFVAIIGLFYRDVVKGIKAATVSIFVLALMVISTEYLNLNKTRLEVYTDGTSACIFLLNKNHSIAIVTNDGRRTANATWDFLQHNFLDEINLLLVINSTNNALHLLENIPATVFVAPGESNTTYNISGIFTVSESDGKININYNDLIINIGHIRNSSNADINITYNFSIHAGDFNGVLIHTSRRADAENPHEFNAFYERIRWNLS